MNIMIFDTETVSLNKPFCYNIGYVIVNLETKETLVKKDFVIEQVWHNLSLFETAYYADKRPLYVSRMKGQKAKMTKYGQVMRTLRSDIKKFDIEYAYAYNSPFDEKVFNFNCDWYKVSNPFDTVKVIDIRPLAMNEFCESAEYKDLCETLEMFTDSGNYSTTAESVYRFVSGDYEFCEEHTALNDSIIESEILLYCYELGCDIFENQSAKRSITRNIPTDLKVKYNGVIVGNYHCKGYTVSKKYDTIYLKGE